MANKKKPNSGNSPKSSSNYMDDYYKQNFKQRKSKKNKHMVGKIIAIIQAILSLAVLGLLLIINMFPTSYVLIAAVILLVLWVFAFFSQFTRGTHIPGKVFSVLMCILLIFGNYYLIVTQNFLGKITRPGQQVDNIVVVVKDDDPAATIEETIYYTYGILAGLDRDKVDETITEINTEFGTTLNIVTYDGYRALVDAFYAGDVQALIYNQAWDDALDEMQEGFTSTIKVIKEKKIISTTESWDSNVAVDQESFAVYISGIDQYGEITQTGRSDVNIVAVVNPNTKDALLVVTPRDYYTEFPGITNGTKDKLTHAGTYSVSASMTTLGAIYGIDIDHFVRINFTSMIQIVNALGGVDVESEQSFTTRHGNYSFVEGTNYNIDGEHALAFARERYNLREGDFQRGRNQLALLEGMLDKAMSPQILRSYVSLLNAFSGNMDTSMSQDQIGSLVKMQLNDNAKWNIKQAAALGTTDSLYCYSLGTNASVVIPDEYSVSIISKAMQAVLDGDTAAMTQALSELDAYKQQ